MSWHSLYIVLVLCITKMLLNTCVTNNHIYVPLVISTWRTFPHLWLTLGFETRVTRQRSLVEQELNPLPEHLISPPVFSEVHVPLSLVLCVCFVDRYLFFYYFLFWPLCCLFFFDVRILFTPLISSSDSSWLCSCTLHVIIVIVCGVFERKRICVDIFYRLFIAVLSLETQLPNDGRARMAQ